MKLSWFFDFLIITNIIGLITKSTGRIKLIPTRLKPSRCKIDGSLGELMRNLRTSKQLIVSETPLDILKILLISKRIATQKKIAKIARNIGDKVPLTNQGIEPKIIDKVYILFVNFMVLF